MFRQARYPLMLLFVVAAFASTIWWLARGGEDDPPAHVLQAVPANAQVVVTVDLDAIRRGPYRQLMLSDAAAALVGSEDASCKTQVVDRLRQLAIWTSSARPGELGLVALGGLTDQAFSACAERTIAQRGGTASSRAARGFRVIVDETLGGEAAQLALRSPGLLLVGPERARLEMMAALERESDEPGLHVRMRQEVALEGDLVLSALVGVDLKRTIARMAGEPTPALDALERVAAAVQLGAVTRLQVLLWCRTADACDRMAEGLEGRREALVRSLPMRAAGVASLVQDARVERQGARLRVLAEAPSVQVLDVLQRLQKLEEVLGGGADGRERTREPDETVRAGPRAAASRPDPSGTGGSSAGASRPPPAR